jgi:hypothetical protein
VVIDPLFRHWLCLLAVVRIPDSPGNAHRGIGMRAWFRRLFYKRDIGI